MRRLNVLTLATALTTTVACAPDWPDSPPKRPISAPIPGDLEREPDALRCQPPALEDEWTYTWDAERLASVVAERTSGLPRSAHVFTYDEAGRLHTWTRGPEGFVGETVLQRDDAGGLVGWTRSGLRSMATVTVTQDDEAVELHLGGAWFSEFSTPLLIELDDIDAELARLAPRDDLFDGYFDRLRVSDEARAAALQTELNATQRIEKTVDGQRTIIDVDGDGAPDVIEQIVVKDAVTQTTIDYAVDPQIDVTVDAIPGRSERVEIDPEGVVSRTVTLTDADHVFLDRLADDGSIDERTSLFFDAQGARLLKYEDRDADGEPNWRKRYINDPVTGLRLFDETDQGANGSVDLRRAYDRDAAGRLLRATLFDLGPDDCGRNW